MGHETFWSRTRLIGWIGMPPLRSAGADELDRAIFGASIQPSKLGAISGAVVTTVGTLLACRLAPSSEAWSLTVAALICMAIGAWLGSKLELRGAGSAILVAIAAGIAAIGWSLSGALLAPGFYAFGAVLYSSCLSLAVLAAALICYGGIAGLALAGDLAISPLHCAARGALAGLLLWRRILGR